MFGRRPRLLGTFPMVDGSFSIVVAPGDHLVNMYSGLKINPTQEIMTTQTMSIGPGYTAHFDSQWQL